MKFFADIAAWALVFFLFMSGIARAAFDGALFAYFRPKLEAFIEQLPEAIQWFL